ncbi:hypothetical protein [Chryseobacterium sp. ERMR1:04]|uniref:hypothetical protein n=1 Tax=Chryseobacterium sp. ERMR1:04 TaxID=1705393 RepID=UPI0006C8775D|nr:hypothetical protein [Chryseobacterium sp. ERMR1:04]KPH11907.1 hypothetical protein AMQ68_21400 [Chryseobacterium sp. ERMR1:04]
MINFIIMLLGLVFGNNNANTTTSNNNQNMLINQTGGQSNPEVGIDPGDTGGDTGQTPPRK